MSETETHAGPKARVATEEPRDQKPDANRCICGAPADGFDAELGRAICAGCAEFQAQVTGDARIVDPTPRHLGATGSLHVVEHRVEALLQDARLRSDDFGGHYFSGRVSALKDVLALFEEVEDASA